MLPFKHNRIMLKSNPLKVFQQDQEESELNKYFNANYINSNVLSSGPAFIASQSPNFHSISHFWQMVWEDNVKLIVMLCPLETGDREESVNYWTVES